MRKINKHYVSNIDIKLKEFDEINPKSASQQAEITKYKRIRRLRDKKTRLRKDQNDIFKDF
jgi:hypothetical protein